ncbi:MAG: type II toxin-antitoxin system VapC family toxin [Polaromonas sp.]|nr:type II toxin-antitoxin system VapC family toxin [Polaromonas sp.]
MRIAFDSSAIFKRYSREDGRDEVAAAFEKATAICVAPHLRLEVLTSASRLRRDALVDEAGYQWLVKQLADDLLSWEVMPFSRAVEDASLRAVEAVRVRAMDALHVGAAIMARADLFVTADPRQAQASRALNLPTQLVTVA